MIVVRLIGFNVEPKSGKCCFSNSYGSVCYLPFQFPSIHVYKSPMFLQRSYTTDHSDSGNSRIGSWSPALIQAGGLAEPRRGQVLTRPDAGFPHMVTVHGCSGHFHMSSA